MTKPCGHEDWETMPDGSCALEDCRLDAGDVMGAFNSEKIQLTLTLGEIDALFKAGGHVLDKPALEPTSHLVSALQKLDEAVNG